MFEREILPHSVLGVGQDGRVLGPGAGGNGTVGLGGFVPRVCYGPGGVGVEEVEVEFLLLGRLVAGCGGAVFSRCRRGMKRDCYHGDG